MAVFLYQYTARRNVRGQRSAAKAYQPIPETTVFQINAPFNTARTGTPFIIYDNVKEGKIRP